MSVNFLAILLSLLASATPLQHENCLPESIDKPCQCKMERSMGVFDISQVFQGVKLPLTIPGPNKGNYPYYRYSPCAPLITDCNGINVAVCEYSIGWGNPNWYHYPIGLMDKTTYNITYSGSYSNITSVEVTYPAAKETSFVKFVLDPARATPEMIWIKNNVNETCFYFEVHTNHLKITKANF